MDGSFSGRVTLITGRAAVSGRRWRVGWPPKEQRWDLAYLTNQVISSAVDNAW
jgi:hypothetical protein